MLPLKVLILIFRNSLLQKIYVLLKIFMCSIVRVFYKYLYFKLIIKDDYRENDYDELDRLFFDNLNFENHLLCRITIMIFIIAIFVIVLFQSRD